MLHFTFEIIQSESSLLVSFSLFEFIQRVHWLSLALNILNDVNILSSANCNFSYDLFIIYACLPKKKKFVESTGCVGTKRFLHVLCAYTRVSCALSRSCVFVFVHFELHFIATVRYRAISYSWLSFQHALQFCDSKHTQWQKITPPNTLYGSWIKFVSASFQECRLTCRHFLLHA